MGLLLSGVIFCGMQRIAMRKRVKAFRTFCVMIDSHKMLSLIVFAAKRMMKGAATLTCFVLERGLKQDGIVRGSRPERRLLEM